MIGALLIGIIIGHGAAVFPSQGCRWVVHGPEVHKFFPKEHINIERHIPRGNCVAKAPDIHIYKDGTWKVYITEEGKRKMLDFASEEDMWRFLKQEWHVPDEVIEDAKERLKIIWMFTALFWIGIGFISVFIGNLARRVLCPA